jgi:hypothetical protein
LTPTRRSRKQAIIMSLFFDRTWTRLDIVCFVKKQARGGVLGR